MRVLPRDQVRTGPCGGQRSRVAGPPRARDGATTVILVTAALAAAGVTLYQLSRPGLLFGATPDISAWLGGSIRLVHGALPYRDFVFTQPPGFALLATPFALLSEVVGTRDALAVLRLCTPLIAAGTVVLTGALVRHRGRAATLVACGVMAVFPAELYALRSGLLESVVDLLSLAGAALVFDGDRFTGSSRRMALGGGAFGFAMLVKLPAILPLVVVAILCVPHLRRRVLPFVGGAAAAFLIPVVPFIVAAPGEFFRDVVATQIGRASASGRVPLPQRLGDMTATSAFGGSGTASIAAAVVIVGIVVAAFVLSRRRPSTFELFVLGSAAIIAMAQVGPAWYYEQYTAFFAPFLALTLAISVARFRGVEPARISLAAAAAAVAALALNQIAFIYGETAPDVATAVDAVVPAGGCTLSNAPKYLVTTNRFVAAALRCTTMTDPQGATLAFANSPAASLAMWQSAFVHADYVVTSTPIAGWDMPRSPVLRDYVAAHFHEVRSGALLFYVRVRLAR